MPTISILRLNEWKLTYRRIEVYLDGKNIGAFPKGKSKEIELSAGEHKLQAKTKWNGSKELNFTLFNKEKKSFVISTNMFLVRPLAILTLVDVILVIFGRNYHFEHEFIRIFKTVLVIMTLIMAIYHFTIGRNNYLIIKEMGPK